MRIAVEGANHVGLVTSICLAEAGNDEFCIYSNHEKVEIEIIPIYNPELTELIQNNCQLDQFSFTCDYEEGSEQIEIVYIVVCISENEYGSTNLQYVEQVVTTIALTAKQDTIVVTKSTVPVGTNDRLQRIIDYTKLYHITAIIVLNSISRDILLPTRYPLMESW